jgi:hemerythrin-like domain-containing protein
MKEAGRGLGFVTTAKGRFVTAAREYADLLANHIGKEDGVVFEAAERLLGPSEAATLDEAFVRFEAQASPSSR